MRSTARSKRAGPMPLHCTRPPGPDQTTTMRVEVPRAARQAQAQAYAAALAADSVTAEMDDARKHARAA